MSLKGLLVNQTFRLFRTVRLICLLTAVVSFGPSAAFAASPQKTTSSTAKKRLTLKSTAAAKKTVSTARSRRAAAARAKAALQARQAKEVAEPRFKLDENGALVPDVRAEAAIIYNPANGKVLYESNAQNQRSIASITSRIDENSSRSAERKDMAPASRRAVRRIRVGSG